MLILNAEVWQHGLADVRIANGRIAAIGQFTPASDEEVINAGVGALLPGLHDHHIHLAALAARRASVWCGPPDITSEKQLSERLAQATGDGWIRGIGYHETVMGLPDAQALDRLVRDRPLRIQHRSGRMWLLNTLALETLLANASPSPGLERGEDGFTGRLFDDDAWLRAALGSGPPCFASVSEELARFGVTGITDMSPANDPAMAEHFAAQIAANSLVQHCWLAGTLALANAAPGTWHLGPAKLHLHEAALPDFDETLDFLQSAHAQGRGVAIHCTTEVELVYSLAALEAVGTITGDRIEHASIASDDNIARIAALNLAVVSQPHFIAERGDEYLSTVEARHIDELYRLRAFVDHGVTLAGGSDAPFGSADPWAAMSAAISRRTRSGSIIGASEALTPEQALALYLADPHDLTSQRGITIGGSADLCLLDRPWAEARLRLSAADVRATIIGGRLVHNRVDQAPA